MTTNSNYNNSLTYALYMANVYKYLLAYYDVYTLILDFYKYNKIEIDSVSLNLALDYLKRGAELNDWNCNVDLSYLYLTGKYLQRDTLKAKECLRRIYTNEDEFNKTWGYYKWKYYDSYFDKLNK